MSTTSSVSPLPSTMRVARLHGIGDLRIEEVPVPTPAPGELLVAIEANGVCATDARKYRVGVNDGDYPFNPGHEWVGRIAALGPGVTGWSVGDRVYGDTYGGYADYALIGVEPSAWSCGPLRVPDRLSLEQAVFVEPLADCVHAVRDQALAGEGSRVVVVAAGSMGLMMTAVAAHRGAELVVVEPQPDRRALSLAFGAVDAVEPSEWPQSVRTRWPDGADAVILCAGNPDLVDGCVAATRNGGRVVLFAGFGDRPVAPVDLNALHYREVALVGSEWIGAPPNQRRDCYAIALDLIVDAQVDVERLITDRCSYDGVEDALIGRSASTVLKTIFIPHRLGGDS